jgi:hypothetical protein
MRCRAVEAMGSGITRVGMRTEVRRRSGVGVSDMTSPPGIASPEVMVPLAPGGHRSVAAPTFALAPFLMRSVAPSTVRVWRRRPGCLRQRLPTHSEQSGAVLCQPIVLVTCTMPEPDKQS